MTNRQLSNGIGYKAQVSTASERDSAGSSRSCSPVPHKPRLHWELQYPIVERQITADGVHISPFRAGFPIELHGFHCSAPNVRMNRHDYCELMYIHSGRGQFQIQDKSFNVSCGDLVVVGPSLYHRVYLTQGARMNIAVLFFQPEPLNDPATADSAAYLMPFFQQSADFPFVVSGPSDVPREVFALMERMRREMPANTARARLTVKTYLKMILVALLNHYAELLDTREAFCERERDLKRLKLLFSFLEDNYSRHVGVVEASRICAMSNSYFMYFFKRVTGQSFITYANHFRIAKAQELLRTTEKSISDISQETGFCDQSHFGAIFRRMVGTTPRCYRQQYGSRIQDLSKSAAEPSVRRPINSSINSSVNPGWSAAPGPHLQ
jgi:AraC-like DNA-binding protein/mannose-6-phosphate isomerase-like protein (cupin superfamily)